MPYFIFQKNSKGISGTVYRIAENDSDLNLLNIDKKDYSIIEDSLDNFNEVKYGLKFIEKYDDNNNIVFIEFSSVFNNKESLLGHLNNIKASIKCFLDNNKNHSQFNNWNNYLNQLNQLNLDTITYPLNKSLEQYFKDENKLSLNPLQLP
jgi:hypothetical protein